MYELLVWIVAECWYQRLIVESFGDDASPRDVVGRRHSFIAMVQETCDGN